MGLDNFILVGAFFVVTQDPRKTPGSFSPVAVAALTLLVLAGWHKLGAWVGLVTGLDAPFLSFADVTNATFGRKVIEAGGPIFKP